MKENQNKCPNCGSLHTNEVSLSNNFCVDCGIEFNRKTQKKYLISTDGVLIDYEKNIQIFNERQATINEFMMCG